jgi:hypothetical protein
MGKLAGHSGTLIVAVIKTVHSKRGKVVKIGSKRNLKRSPTLKTGMPFIAKTIKDEKNTSHNCNTYWGKRF